MKTIRTLVAFAALTVAGSAFAGPFDQGMVGGQLKANARVGTVNMNNKAGLGYAKQELNVATVNGGKVLGNVELNARAKDITMTNKAGLGYATQQANIATIK